MVPTLLLFGLDPRATADAENIVREFGIASAEVNDLRAACAALVVERPAMLLASTALKPWDREIIEEHAARASIPLTWVEANDAHVVDDAVRRWVTSITRHPRYRPPPR